MNAYLIDSIRLAVPGFVVMTLSAAPLAVAVVFATMHRRRGEAGSYRRALFASTAAGIVALGMLLPTFIGIGPRSSTAGLIFLAVPIYSAAALGVGYGLHALAHRLASCKNSASITKIESIFIAAPYFMLAVLLVGMLKLTVQRNDTVVAERATNLETLHFVFQRARSGKADGTRVPLFLAQNKSTPSDILDVLGQHNDEGVRYFVARHSNTSQAAIEFLSNDCSVRIRELVRDKLQLPPATDGAAQQNDCGPR